MKFLQTIKNSIYSPEFYSKISKTSFWSALGYFLLLSLILTSLRSINPIKTFLNNGQKAVYETINKASNFYPQNLTINIKNGIVTSNVKEPYFITFKQEKSSKDIRDLVNLLVIDTKTNFSAKQFNNYEALAWLGKDSIFIKTNNNQTRAIDLSQITSLTIDHNLIQSILLKFAPIFKLISPFVITFIFLGIYLLYSARLVYFLFLALLVLVLAKLFKKELTYSNAYKMAIYGSTLGLLVSLLIELTNTKGFPFMFSFISLGVISVNFLFNTKSTTKRRK